ncbi:hypothetical protein PUN28_002495 [Cardiocondyla obscurior]|uniref:Uncharacterized protein n=1 Tax=Cardiocondyla obscurior TaxID=286306 RepID=A0AAW2GUG7_9HYME
MQEKYLQSQFDFSIITAISLKVHCFVVTCWQRRSNAMATADSINLESEFTGNSRARREEQFVKYTPRRIPNGSARLQTYLFTSAQFSLRRKLFYSFITRTCHVVHTDNWLTTGKKRKKKCICSKKCKLLDPISNEREINLDYAPTHRLAHDKHNSHHLLTSISDFTVTARRAERSRLVNSLTFFYLCSNTVNFKRNIKVPNL